MNRGFTGNGAVYINVCDNVGCGAVLKVKKVWEGAKLHVKGFDGQDSRVFGQCELEVKFGPCQRVKKYVFLVCQDATMSILRIPALQQFDIDINCENKTLTDRKLGRVAFCEIVCEKMGRPSE